MLPGGPFCFGAVGVILFLVGLKTGWDALKDWRRYRKSDNWIPITGLITTSYVNMVPSLDESPSQHYPVIKYTYQLMGKSYEGSRVSFGSEKKSYEKSKKAERVVARHLAGSQPTVYYDPDDPSQSVLERKYDPYKAILGLIFGLCGAWMLYLVYIQ
jgi:hypothetical protein